MTLAPEKELTFEEFAGLPSHLRVELVDGRLEELVSPRPLHAWSGARLAALLDPYLTAHHPQGFWGGELDIPTLPRRGRRPDFAFYSAADAARGLDLEANRVLGRPTLVVEVVSEDDIERDRITKRDEYARAGIPWYWIVDPQARSVTVLRLTAGAYASEGEFAAPEILTTALFPGLTLPLDALFR